VLDRALLAPALVLLGTAEQPLLAAVPTRGVTTVYSRVGDSFASLSIAGLPLLAAMTLLRRPFGRRAGAPALLST
jgi:apolipoprotein N-acyltransferase